VYSGSTARTQPPTSTRACEAEPEMTHGRERTPAARVPELDGAWSGGGGIDGRPAEVEWLPPTRPEPDNYGGQAMQRQLVHAAAQGGG
jgi:hypothetical protein